MLQEKLKGLTEELSVLENKVGKLQDFCAHLIHLENKRQEAFAYTDRQQPEKMFEFTVKYDNVEIKGDIPAKTLEKLLSKGNSDLDKYRALKDKISKVEQLLGE